MSLMDLLTVAIAFFVVAASPGPATLAVATVSLRSGRRAGFAMGLGLALGLAVWGCVAALGLGAVLQQSARALMALKIAGGLYLLWLAWQSAQAARAAQMTVTDAQDGGRWLWRGLLLNLSNPKAVVAWMATLALGLGEAGTPAQVWLATGLCAAIGAAIYAGYAWLFSIRGAMVFYTRAHRWVDGVVAGLFAVAGVGLIRSAFVRS